MNGQRQSADQRPVRRARRNDPRSLERLNVHYDLEVALAEKLREAPSSERGRLYTQVYDELFASLPDHSQFTRRDGAYVARLDQQFAALRPLLRPDTTFLEIGAGDCRLSLRIAPLVGRVIAVDVSDKVADLSGAPANFSLVLSGGTDIPVKSGTIDLAHSSDLIEHLHPADAILQLDSIYNALRPGGIYVCWTPSRLSGPHDISGLYDDVAKGFHLKEYTAGELRVLMRQAGFRRVRFQIVLPGLPAFYHPCLLGFERVVGLLRRWGWDIGRYRVINLLLRIRAVAVK